MARGRVLKKIAIVTGVVVGILVVALACLWWCARPENSDPTVAVGTIERYKDFASRYVEPREVAVWLPQGYRRGDSCDVLYMHDGQMLFDATTTWNRREWSVDEIAGRMMAADSLRRFIIVAVNNSDNRLEEYFPEGAWRYLPPAEQRDVAKDKLLGDKYLRFLVEEVKPFVDSTYHPLDGPGHTFVMGSSMGGLISLYALCEYPQVFGGAACLSSHLSMTYVGHGSGEGPWQEAFVRYLDARLPAANSHLVYMDHGTQGFDADYGVPQQRVDSLFAAKSWDNVHYMSRVYQGHDHNETDWARRLDVPLYFLLGRGAPRR